MGLSSILTSIFDRFRGSAGTTEAGRGFDFRSFDDNVSRLLADHNILNVRNVGGTFRIPDGLAQSFRSMAFEQNFDVATIVLSDREKDGTAAAFMVGLRHDGTYGIRSLQNVARPNDLDSYVNRIQGRIHAHQYRQTFNASATLLRPELPNGFYPERFIGRPSALTPLGRGAALAMA